MEMTMREFINTYYPDAKNHIRNHISNPIKRVMGEDNLPCDGVKIVDGEYEKVLYLDDNGDDFISVSLLISLTKEEILIYNNPSLEQVYDNYMSTINIRDLTIQDIMSSARIFYAQNEKDKIKRQLCIK